MVRSTLAIGALMSALFHPGCAGVLFMEPGAADGTTFDLDQFVQFLLLWESFPLLAISKTRAGKHPLGCCKSVVLLANLTLPKLLVLSLTFLLDFF